MQSTVRGQGYYADLSQDLSIEESYLRFNHPSIYGTKRDKSYNGAFPNKCKCPSQKGKLLLVFWDFFFLNKSDQNNPYAKEIYFGVAYSALLDMDVPQFVYAFVCWKTY